MKKSSWKKFVKKKAHEAFLKEFEEKKLVTKKLRFLNSQAVKTYLCYLTNQKARMAIIIRLNMFESMTHKQRGKVVLSVEMKTTQQNMPLNVRAGEIRNWISQT